MMCNAEDTIKSRDTRALWLFPAILLSLKDKMMLRWHGQVRRGFPDNLTLAAMKLYEIGPFQLILV
jgi:hypothetical protein